MAPQDLLIEQTDDHIAVVRLNRPDHLNALRSATLDELASALEEARRDDTRVVVVTGSARPSQPAPTSTRLSDCGPPGPWPMTPGIATGQGSRIAPCQ